MTENSLLPLNASAQERAVEGSVSRAVEVATPIRDLWNPDTCPEVLLPWLAWGLSVDDWQPEWRVESKRAAIRNAVEVHKRKGTRRALEDAIEPFGARIELEEWWQVTPRGAPHTFKATVYTNDPGTGLIDGTIQRAILNAVNRVKPVRSHFDLVLGLWAKGSINVLGYSVCTKYRRISVPLVITYGPRARGQINTLGYSRPMQYKRLTGNANK